MVLFSHFSAWSASGPPCPLFPAEQQHLCLGVTQRTLFLWWREIMKLQSSFLWASCKSQPFWQWAGKGGCVAHNSQSIECGITARVGTPAKSPTPGRGPQTAPLHPRQLGALGWHPGTFCPGHAHRAQWERRGRSPPPAPVPASSWAGSMCLGRGCAPQRSTHHSGQAGPGRAPPLAAPHPLAASAAAPARSLPGDTWEQVGPSVPGSHPRQVAACRDL